MKHGSIPEIWPSKCLNESLVKNPNMPGCICQPPRRRADRRFRHSRLFRRGPGWLLSNLTGVESFFAGMAQAQPAGGRDEEQARFDEEFAAIEPVYGGIFQGGVGEKGWPGHVGGRE